MESQIDIETRKPRYEYHSEAFSFQLEDFFKRQLPLLQRKRLRLLGSMLRFCIAIRLEPKCCFRFLHTKSYEVELVSKH